MVQLYCQAHHQGRPLCPDCIELVAYSHKRLQYCPHGANKPTCGQCEIHCYASKHRAQIKTVMRYAGPRMVYKAPFLALVHAWDSFWSRLGYLGSQWRHRRSLKSR
ncbi:MAG: nitrous oxide-stimulated promoter family protein [Fibrobacter sp.]|nr:nitrous oxide-stimulated promoter family protein [Fibrobacter sp.]